MYFGVVVDSRSHLWRQAFPDGAPEQITFDPTEEQGVAVAPDGQSLVTSVGQDRSAIWIHDEAGDRQITSEGSARLPQMSGDGGRVFYLQGSDLRQVDLASSRSTTVLPGFTGYGYEVSRDATEVAFTRRDDGGSGIWLASLDRRSAPRQITNAGDSVSFGPNGSLIFRQADGNANYLYRVNKDGSGRERITRDPILNKSGVSPDAEWVIVHRALTGDDVAQGESRTETVAIPVRGGAPRRICAFDCPMRWSPDGRSLYLTRDPSRTVAVPVSFGQLLPELPASGTSSPADLLTLTGARPIDQQPVIGNLNDSAYVFLKTDIRRNLFRIRLR